MFRRGYDIIRLFQRYSSHLLTISELPKITGSHFLPIPTIGPADWTYRSEEKQRLLYAILTPRITSSLSKLLIDLFDLNLMQEWFRFDLRDNDELSGVLNLQQGDEPETFREKDEKCNKVLDMRPISIDTVHRADAWTARR